MQFKQKALTTEISKIWNRFPAKSKAWNTLLGKKTKTPTHGNSNSFCYFYSFC